MIHKVMETQWHDMLQKGGKDVEKGKVWKKEKEYVKYKQNLLLYRDHYYGA